MILFPPELDVLAFRQHGLLTHRQLLVHMSASAIERLVRAGHLIRAMRGIFRLPAARPTWRQRACAHCLHLGGEVALSHLAAAYLFQVPCIARPGIELTVPPRRALRRRDITVHRRPLTDDVTQCHGIPVTTPVRTVIDLSRTVAPTLVQRVFDDLVRMGRLEPTEVGVRLAHPATLPACRRPVLDAVDRRSGTRVRGGSPPEDWVVDTLVEAGLPAPERHVMVELEGRMREIDCAYVAQKVAIEYDGRATHRPQFHRDREKVAMLCAEGWSVLPVTAEWTAEQLVDRTRRALGR